MILFSVVLRQWIRQKFIIFPRFCITGDAMRILQLKIRKAKLTHSRQENVQLRHIMREPASMQKFIRENFWDFTGQDLFVTMIR